MTRIALLIPQGMNASKLAMCSLCIQPGSIIPGVEQHNSHRDKNAPGQEPLPTTQPMAFAEITAMARIAGSQVLAVGRLGHTEPCYHNFSACQVCTHIITVIASDIGICTSTQLCSHA